VIFTCYKMRLSAARGPGKHEQAHTRPIHCIPAHPSAGITQDSTAERKAGQPCREKKPRSTHTSFSLIIQPPAGARRTESQKLLESLKTQQKHFWFPAQHQARCREIQTRISRTEHSAYKKTTSAVSREREKQGDEVRNNEMTRKRCSPPSA